MTSCGPKANAAAATISAANRLGLDYTAEARRLPRPPATIIDAHTHINGPAAARIYQRVAGLYGIGLTYSMTQLEQVEPIRDIFGSSIRFIAVPNYGGEDRRHHHGRGFVERIEKFHAQGARIVKFWAAPRGIDYGREVGDDGLLRLDSGARLEAMQLAADLGMIFMTHVADPDTWFATKYADTTRYGTKRQQYEPLEELLDRFGQPWIAAHMGGWPEDLEFLWGLLERHDNLYLDTSAAKWMARELSRHPRQTLVDFMTRFRGRILFGTDTVVDDEHLTAAETPNETPKAANSTEEAFELYASRYWALRTLFETDYSGPSPIADPDLALVEPDRHTQLDGSELSGKRLPEEVIGSLYGGAARELLEGVHG